MNTIDHGYSNVCSFCLKHYLDRCNWQRIKQIPKSNTSSIEIACASILRPSFISYSE
ncbi:hypothetical protein RO3G_05183 [Rhizopus delemar RA 99-880]|uniref:Uncharacterized protein n=1 Tax=Rhizopus delemar (strain RA 99-880 / ATCC MYA-4621 / FGSC 9543 / NRRL 43880) TaxID=246409 RepID=I1BW98_RHIO9|nr:hypothetical protein RO3G_05183 [Rhizopus delemar RA 99-880]|eukprot:EIE80478.1 hypothetical protein RO3G_05183 [Rhizopus delemar RA 99-880]